MGALNTKKKKFKITAKNNYFELKPLALCSSIETICNAKQLIEKWNNLIRVCFECFAAEMHLFYDTLELSRMHRGWKIFIIFLFLSFFFLFNEKLKNAQDIRLRIKRYECFWCFPSGCHCHSQGNVKKKKWFDFCTTIDFMHQHSSFNYFFLLFLSPITPLIFNHKPYSSRTFPSKSIRWKTRWFFVLLKFKHYFSYIVYWILLLPLACFI